jgi:hypothetical protein
MKNQLTLWLLAFTLPCLAQQNIYPIETVGTPASIIPVTSYTGWSNNGLLIYSGTAEIQNDICSNNIGASGYGNIYFSNVPGKSFELTGLNAALPPSSVDITFGMFGYDPNNLTELVLEYTIDGINYSPLAYKRLFRYFFPPTPWDVMVSDPLPASVNIATLKYRFRQTSNTKSFRIDDIQVNYYYSLPIKLISFSMNSNKNEVALNWRATCDNNSEIFIVEKSIDGRSFTPVSNNIAVKKGDHSYSFTDGNFSARSFYRLKMKDASGKVNYSQVLLADKKIIKGGLINNLYPMPASETLNVQLYSNATQKATVSLTDATGKTVKNISVSLAEGINNSAIDVRSLQSGMYFLKVATTNAIESKLVFID